MQVEQTNAHDTGLSFTCNTCGLTFPTADLQRLHMRTDWHRYNLKRRVAQLPPITSEMFAEKMLQQEKVQQMEEEKTGRGSNKRSSGNRQFTKKDKKKEEKLAKRMAQMNLNRKMSEQQTADNDKNLDEEESDDDEIERPGSPASMVSSTFSLGDPVDHDDSKTDELHDADSVQDEEEKVEDEQEKEIKRKLARAVKIPPNVCLVDGKKFDTVDENVAYMELKYGLFIPEREYLVDLEGMITYLGEKIGLGNICLYCGFEGRSVESVRQHMISKGHVKIPYETTNEKLELADYYDFRSSYRTKPKTQVGEEAGEDDEEWEDEDVEEVSDFSDDEDFDDDEGGAYVDETGYELALPSGYRAGHRSLARYYNQNLRPSTVTREGQGTVLAVDTKKSLGLRDPVEAKQQKQAWKAEKKVKNVHMRRDKMVNFQHHFRDELLQ